MKIQFKLSSFSFQILNYDTASIQFYCLNKFPDDNKNKLIQLCSKEIGEMTKKIKMSKALVTEREVKRWFI